MMVLDLNLKFSVMKFLILRWHLYNLLPQQMLTSLESPILYYSFSVFKIKSKFHFYWDIILSLFNFTLVTFPYLTSFDVDKIKPMPSHVCLFFLREGWVGKENLLLAKLNNFLAAAEEPLAKIA